MKLPPAKHELTEEEQDELDAQMLEVELFEEHELPIFLTLLEAHADLDPEDALSALHICFFRGWFGWPSCVAGRDIQGWMPMEIGKFLYDRVEAGYTTYQNVATGLAQAVKAYGISQETC